jgi:hypothetical protein
MHHAPEGSDVVPDEAVFKIHEEALTRRDEGRSREV